MFDKPKITPLCHSSRPHYAKGLCRSCYLKQLNRLKRAKLAPSQIKRRQRTFDTTPPRTPLIAGPHISKEQQADKALVTVTLTMRHSFNGKFYGPGTVRLSESKGNLFLSQEQAAGEKELDLQQQKAYIITLGGGAPAKRQVPWAQFDTILNQS